MTSGDTQLFGKPWLVEQAYFSDFLENLPTLQASSAISQPVRPIPLEIKGNVAVIRVTGLLTAEAGLISFMTGSSTYEEIQNSIREVNELEEVDAVLVKIRSPGGEASGALETSDLLSKLAEEKLVVAVCSGMVASAAYWIAAGASRIIVSPTTMVGSVGTAMEHRDQSRLDRAMGLTFTDITSGRFKRLGTPHAPLTQEARAYLQSQIDDLGQVFLADIQRQRNLTDENMEQIREAQVHIGANSVNAGLADRLGFFDETLTAMQRVDENPSVAMVRETAVEEETIDMSQTEATTMQPTVTEVVQQAAPQQAAVQQAAPQQAVSVTDEKARIKEILALGEKTGLSAEATYAAFETEMSAGEAAVYLLNHENYGKKKQQVTQPDTQRQSQAAAFFEESDGIAASYAESSDASDKEENPWLNLLNVAAETHNKGVVASYPQGGVVSIRTSDAQ